MRSPGGGASHRAGRNFEEELSLKYLSPGAFTVLTPQEYGTPPDPPSAPTQYRLTPNSRRRRAQAFSIIAEGTSNPGSRSPSPSGRVSPFRGRGFNPTGSRHASPNPSPPPEDVRVASNKQRYKSNESPKKSQIPQPYRKGSGGGGVFGEKLNQDASPKFRRKNGSKLSPQLSKSLTNLSPKSVAGKPPPSPGKNRKFSKRPAFEQLSPITGSSPESGPKENQNQSSVSKIPRSSRSQPVSRRASPTRTMSPTDKNYRPGSKSDSRSNSRDPSPTKAHTKIPVNKNAYKEVSAKVNSFSKPKPKVPPKPQDIQSASGGDRNRNAKAKLSRKESIGKFNTTKANGGNNKTNEAEEGKNSASKKSNKRRDNNNLIDMDKIEEVKSISSMNEIESPSSKNEESSGMKHVESAGKLSDITTATTVVSSTTSTAAQPLKIDANLENILKEEFNKPKERSLYSAAGRVLSATSVSSAMNRMNDTVLNSQTLMKDHNFTKLSPAASAIISLSNDANRGNKALDTKVAVTALPTIETTLQIKDGVLGVNGKNSFGDSNNVFSVETFDGAVKNFNSLITPERKLGVSGTVVVQKSANERIREARTMVAADVKPIKILVKEKPSDVEVQSGNVRLPVSATNGLNSTPGLPPTQPPENEEPPPHEEEEETTKPNCCARVFRCCKCKSKSFKCCKKAPKKEKKTDERTGCFGCRKRTEADESASSADNLVTENEKKTKLFDRLKCCRSKKICCSRCKKKKGWAERRASFGSDVVKSSIESENKCKRIFKRMFCSTCCKKKVEDPISRRESVLSKKKSLTPTLPIEEPKPKLDASLVEHTSHMRGAIPVLPIPLAWFCLICNVILPGVGTIFSGMFCLCLGKPRFSQNDGPRPRIGAFLINLVIGCGQLFTVLFCLVGWGWSIWWGVIMLKIARKHNRIRLAEQRAAAQDDRQVPVINQNHHARDLERGS